jgi:hypothetical protein
MEDLNDALNLRIIEDVWAGVRVNTCTESTMVSNFLKWLYDFTTLRSSSLLSDLPRAFTVDLWPEYKAVAEFAESVINESIECVI